MMRLTAGKSLPIGVRFVRVEGLWAADNMSAHGRKHPLGSGNVAEVRNARLLSTDAGRIGRLQYGHNYCNSIIIEGLRLCTGGPFGFAADLNTPKLSHMIASTIHYWPRRIDVQSRSDNRLVQSIARATTRPRRFSPSLTYLEIDTRMGRSYGNSGESYISKLQLPRLLVVFGANVASSVSRLFLAKNYIRVCGKHV